MEKQTKKKLLSTLVAGFLLCYPGSYLWAGGDSKVEPAVVQQTEKVVTGIVTDGKGEPMIGVSVSVQGTKEGTVTDENGHYSIRVQNNRQILVFSYLGCKNATVTTNKEQINVTMEDDPRLLGEVVVIGYGTQKKENLTGAVSSVDVQKTLDGRAIPDAGRGLQGTTPGLSIRLNDSEIGSDPTIRIRGQIAAYQGSSTPLILLDNVEIPSLNLVNPDDIESISVLKDAASASIYGAKGAFGVVLITTKKGAKTDGAHITYSGNFSWQNASKKYEMGGVEAMEYAWLAAKNANPGVTDVGAFYMVNEQQLDAAREWAKTYGGKLGPNDPTVYGRDWYFDGKYKYGLRTYDPYEYLVKEWAPTQDHKIAVNGRAGNTTYNVGLNYLDQSGMNKAAKKDRFARYTGTIRVNSELNKHVSVNAGAMYSTREKDYPYHTGTNIDQWYYLYRWGPQYPLGVDERGNDIRSPWSEFQQANTASRKWNYTSFNIGSVLTFTKEWTFNFDYTHANTEWREFIPGIIFTAADSWNPPVVRNDASGNPIYVNNKGEVVPAGTADAYRAYDLNMATYTGGTAPNTVRTNTSNSRQNTINAYTTYNLKLNDENVFKFMLGMNRVTYETVSEFARIDGLTNIENPQYAFTSGAQYAGGDFAWQSQLGYFGRINYVLKDRYLLEGNLRYDGSSKFPTDLKWRWFPSFSAGWRASEEAFMDWARPSLSTLKFRGSFGLIGDQTVPGSLYIATMGSSGQISWLDSSGNRINYVGAPSSVASDITWQDIQTTDIGVDARFFNNDLGFTFDWYRRDTKNMIVPNETTTTTYGVAAPLGNYGSLRTNGWEFSVDFNHRFKNGIGINGMFTFSDAKTIITKWGNGRIVDNWYNGKTYGEIWGYRTDRLYQYSDFELDAGGNLQLITLDASAGPLNAGKKAYKLKGENPVYQAYLQSGSFYFQPGDVKFKDLDGDGQISLGDNTVENPGDREIIGNTTPRYEYGFRLGADYAGFDFSVFFQGIGKRDLWGNSSLTLAGFNPADGAIAKTLCTDYWTKENPNAFYPRPWPQANENNAFNMRPQDRYLLNMAYLRLKNITLGYTVPALLAKKYWIQKARIYVSAENLYTWDHLNGLPVDPEIIPGFSVFASNAAGDNYQSGRAGLGIPTFKNVSVGIQLNF